MNGFNNHAEQAVTNTGFSLSLYGRPNLRAGKLKNNSAPKHSNLLLLHSPLLDAMERGRRLTSSPPPPALSY